MFVIVRYRLTVTTTMSTKGQVVIPAEVRERQNLRPGDQLVIEERKDEVVLKKARRQRKKSLLQWMLDCPVSDFRIERLKEPAKDIKL
ncbi:MAG TPA: AbrB/MazE/SpoVT family DNA-binding domain-containing protein, partial [Candidatus Polarisedimenticolia bacterium]|nr:AbrB/MazE/SpoVT family DNA-binding domain-containing protein [Candidatus Polarisedimenticolia bacterium]